MAGRAKCVVANCPNSMSIAPDKAYFVVPAQPEKRRRWLLAAGLSLDHYGPKTSLHVCEDHFDLPNDMENFMKYKLMGVKRKVIKAGVVPHKFALNQGAVMSSQWIDENVETGGENVSARKRLWCDAEEQMNVKETFREEQINYICSKLEPEDVPATEYTREFKLEHTIAICEPIKPELDFFKEEPIDESMLNEESLIEYVKEGNGLGVYIKQDNLEEGVADLLTHDTFGAILILTRGFESKTVHTNDRIQQRWLQIYGYTATLVVAIYI